MDQTLVATIRQTLADGLYVVFRRVARLGATGGVERSPAGNLEGGG
jgi:hypothetical protein